MMGDLTRHLPAGKLGQPLYTMLPLRMVTGVCALKTQAIILPHVLWSKIYHNYPHVWRSRICPSPAAVTRFWEAMDQHPTKSLLENREGGLGKLVPFAIHADDVPVAGVGKSWQKMCTEFSWTTIYTILFSLLCFVCKRRLLKYVLLSWYYKRRLSYNSRQQLKECFAVNIQSTTGAAFWAMVRPATHSTSFGRATLCCSTSRLRRHETQCDALFGFWLGH